MKWLDGESLTDLAVIERQVIEFLEQVLSGSEINLEGLSVAGLRRAGYLLELAAYEFAEDEEDEEELADLADQLFLQVEQMLGPVEEWPVLNFHPAFNSISKHVDAYAAHWKIQQIPRKSRLQKLMSTLTR